MPFSQSISELIHDVSHEISWNIANQKAASHGHIHYLPNEHDLEGKNSLVNDHEHLYLLTINNLLNSSENEENNDNARRVTYHKHLPVQQLEGLVDLVELIPTSPFYYQEITDFQISNNPSPPPKRVYI